MDDRQEMERRRRKKLREKKRRKRKRIITSFVVVILIILVALGIKLAFDRFYRDELEGTWTPDESTYYQFDGKGRGALIVQPSRYRFSYTYKDGRLSIDFDSEKATDADYMVTLEGDELTLSIGQGSAEPVNITLYRTE